MPSIGLSAHCGRIQKSLDHININRMEKYEIDNHKEETNDNHDVKFFRVLRSKEESYKQPAWVVWRKNGKQKTMIIF